MDEVLARIIIKAVGSVRDKAAVEVGQGRVLLYSTNPVYRWQNHGEFNMVFNSILNWNDLPAAKPLANPVSDGGSRP